MSLEKLKGWMEQVAKDYNSKFADVGNGIFRVDVPLQYKDGTWRYQYVWGRVTPGYAKGMDTYYFNSRAGELTRGVDTYQMLQEAGMGVYSMITVIKDKRPDGSECETLLVQASPVVNFTNDYNQVKYIISEVAEVADFLEKKYFGGNDQN